MKLARRSGVAGTEAGIVVAVILGLFLVGGLVAFFILRALRQRSYRPKYIPGRRLKRRWNAWTPGSSNPRYSTTLQEQGQATLRTGSRSPSLAAFPNMSRTTLPNTSSGTSTQPNETVVDRHTSVRSIMTLPAYTPDARPTEEVIGRAGEREGIDTVIEFPETVEEEEARRDEEMESLYQIRQARRDERTDREERRRLRAEARTRNDTAALEELRQRGRDRATSSTSQLNSSNLISDHQNRDRGRRVSTVAYGEVGLARHDGSRLRADSNVSDSAPLLDSAASMGGRRSRSGSAARSLDAFRTHLRNQSSSSLRQITPEPSDDDRNSEESVRLRQPTQDGATVSSGQPSPLEEIPLTEPPQYTNIERDPRGEAPPYESPTEAQRPHLAGAVTLPTIEITPFSPVIDDDSAAR